MVLEGGKRGGRSGQGGGGKGVSNKLYIRRIEDY